VSNIPHFALRAGHRGMTLAELLISLTILSMMSVVLAGMSNAVNSAWSYTRCCGPAADPEASPRTAC
jgi:prepilin-type N-terminal cleavage/methylation domain-containing protein